MKSQGKAIAYPGLPAIFAEGFKDYKSRISGHSHISLAVTDIHEMVRTETTANLAEEGVKFDLVGLDRENARVTGVYTVIDSMLALATDRTGISINTKNNGILTGSSDSGAAALVTALDDVLELGLPLPRMIELARHVSETAYRSLVGGLSECIVDENGRLHISQLRGASFFSDVNIYVVSFPEIKRHSADDLHLRVVNHPHYTKRHEEVERRIGTMHKFLEKNDMKGVLAVMEADAMTVHSMFTEMGLSVIKPEMKVVCDLVDNLRESNIQAFWTVAGGSHVYIFTQKKYAKEVTHDLKAHDFKYKHYKVAEGAKAVL
jgi:mevalonate pyrophosphate decarboxylase